MICTHRLCPLLYLSLFRGLQAISCAGSGHRGTVRHKVKIHHTLRSQWHTSGWCRKVGTDSAPDLTYGLLLLEHTSRCRKACASTRTHSLPVAATGCSGLSMSMQCQWQLIPRKMPLYHYSISPPGSPGRGCTACRSGRSSCPSTAEPLDVNVMSEFPRTVRFRKGLKTAQHEGYHTDSSAPPKVGRSSSAYIEAGQHL